MLFIVRTLNNEQLAYFVDNVKFINMCVNVYFKFDFLPKILDQETHPSPKFSTLSKSLSSLP